MVTDRIEWVTDERLAGEVDDIFARAIASYRANPHLITEHANHEESIRVGGYSNRTLLELVQNAADAMSGRDEHVEGVGRVELVLDLEREVLYCANAGRPFSWSGLTSIAHAHLSGKRGDEIGRFGLGFKSVLAVTDTPQVFSRSISFEFNSPKARTAIASVGSTERRLPILRAMTRIDADAEFDRDPTLKELSSWAATIIRLPRVSNAANLQREIENFRSEFLLFVNDVREVRLRVIGGESDSVKSHVSRDLGEGRFRIERSGDDHTEWYVEDHMHAPGPEARAEVGEAVSRDRVKITVAMPVRWSQRKTGEFWSYFPLQDRTSASALFNAPWSLNDDRTTLLKNTYNQEILTAFSEIFVSMLSKISSGEDPAAHLEYMPARGREAQSFGDELMCEHIPRIASGRALIPDAAGALRVPSELCPLDFRVPDVNDQDHREWSASPHTGDNVPHWRCYSGSQRKMRLRWLYVHSVHSAHSVFSEVRALDEKWALEKMHKRGVLSWLREWAEGDHLESTVQAFEFVLSHPGVEKIKSAKVIPTTGGLCSLSDHDKIFLERAEDVDIEGASFVQPEFLAYPGVVPKLRENFFRDLDPVAILRARMAKLTEEPEDDELPKLWAAVRDVPLAQAREVLSKDRVGRIKVPTRDGGWAAPRQVLDIDGLGADVDHRVLDRARCTPELALALGVVQTAVAAYSIENEPFFAEFHQYVLDKINRELGPGERPVERIEFVQNEGPGPFSVLLMLEEADAPAQVRESWTSRLLELSGRTSWICEDMDSGQTREVVSPVEWAVRRAGLLKSKGGYRTPERVVSRSLVEFEDLLPLFDGSRQVEDALPLPKALDTVPADVLREALEQELFPPRIKDSTLTRFVLESGALAYPEGRPIAVPARIRRAIESRRPDLVYVATTDEQQEFLGSRDKPYLRANPEQMEALVRAVGCRWFEDSFSFSTHLEGLQGEEAVLDLFTGLRSTFEEEWVKNATVVKAVRIAKRVTTREGVEDQPLRYHREGEKLFVLADSEERRVLELVNEAFELRMSNADLEDVLQRGVDQRVEEQRQQARAAANDAERLEVYFGDDTLRESLPTGLWPALAAQGLVNDHTSVAKLFLSVYGRDSIIQLKDQFAAENHTDVPAHWAGSPTTISWLRKMGFGAEYAGTRSQSQDQEFVVPGAVKLSPLHDFQEQISRDLRKVLTLRAGNGQASKAMVELPTGAGKTRVASETLLRLFIDGSKSGPVLWIAQSAELCEQAVQTFSTVWRGLGDDRPLTIGRLWDTNVVHEPDTEFSIVVATDAKLEKVLGEPNYEWLTRAEAVFIDEAHRAGGSSRYTNILRLLGVDGRHWERPLVGLSATPFKGRGDNTEPTRELASRFGENKISAFKDDVYEQLVRRGVLARVKHTVLSGAEVSLKPDELRKAREFNKLDSEVLERIGRDQERMRVLVHHILARDPDWPVLVFTPSVLSAQILAATLRYRDVAAESVSGKTRRQTRRDIIAKFKRGDVRVLVNCDLLVQGFDAPGVRALYIARPTFSPSAYIQMAGRGLRGLRNGGKEECLIVDVADNFGAMNDFLGYRAYEDLWLEQTT